MTGDPDDRSRALDDGTTGWSRRNLLKIGGVGVGIAALGGLSAVGTGQEDGGGGNQTVGSDVVFDDLSDPVFGYPLAADESDAVTLDHVVELSVEEGPGAHEGFPEEPNPDAPGSTVETPAEFVFDPVGLAVEPGSLVQFDTVSALHTATAFHEKFSEPGLEIPNRVPEGVPGFTSPPMTAGESWVYEFSTSGVYDLFCFPHLGLGMVMRIVVFDPDEDDIDDALFEAPSAGPLFPNDERVLEAGALDPANIVDAGTVAWDELTLADVETETPTEEPETETETETETEEPETETETAEPETETETETPGTETEEPETETEEPETETETETETEE